MYYCQHSEIYKKNNETTHHILTIFQKLVTQPKKDCHQVSLITYTTAFNIGKEEHIG